MLATHRFRATLSDHIGAFGACYVGNGIQVSLSEVLRFVEITS